MSDALAQITHCVPAERIDELVASACRSYLSDRTWAEYDLVDGFEDLWKLSSREDACYDRPSIGLSYALWYQGRRTHDALRLLACRFGDEEEPLTEVLDLGCGTGATAWALGIAAAAGLLHHPVRVVGIDGSPPMIDAAEHMWASLLAQPGMTRAAQLVSFEAHCRTWTQPGVKTERPDVVGAYLFDDSDRARVAEVAGATARVAEHYGSRFLHLMSTNRKQELLRRACEALRAKGWSVTRDGLAPSVWDAPMTATGRLRSEVYDGTAAAARVRARAPHTAHGNGSPVVVRLRSPQVDGQLDLAPAPGTFVLDEAQGRAAEPEDRMTVVIGAAGSGKSRVLVERVARSVEIEVARQGDARFRRPPPNVLVTAFNKQLVEQLAQWFEERMAESRVPLVRQLRGQSDQGDITFRHRDLPRLAAVRFLNWDKIPSRVAGVRSGKPARDGFPRRRDVIAGWHAPMTSPTEAALEADFAVAELHRVIWGLGISSLSDYLETARHGRLTPLQGPARRALWDLWMGEGHRYTFDHARMEALRQLEQPDSGVVTFTHVFIDECQDFAPADFALAGLLVDDSQHLVAAGDETQSMHLGGCYRRPGLVTGRNGQARQWTSKHQLKGSYRLPLRICEAIRPLADELRARHSRPGEDEELRDFISPEAVRTASLGLRPVVIAGTTPQMTGMLKAVIDTYSPLISGSATGNPMVTVAEGEPLFDNASEWLPAGYEVRRESMLAIKGLERPCVVWSTRSEIAADVETSSEWIYTLLTRTTALLVIALSAETVPHVAQAIAKLRRDRLLFWTSEAGTLFTRLVADHKGI